MARVTCKDCVDLLADYLEGELATELEKALDEHICACPPCLEFLDEYRGASKICRRALAEEMPDGLASKLHEFLEKNCK